MHGTGGDYGNDQGGGSDDDGGYEEGLHGTDGQYPYYTSGGGAGQDWPVGSPSEINATGSQPGRRD